MALIGASGVNIASRTGLLGGARRGGVAGSARLSGTSCCASFWCSRGHPWHRGLDSLVVSIDAFEGCEIYFWRDMPGLTCLRRGESGSRSRSRSRSVRFFSLFLLPFSLSFPSLPCLLSTFPGSRIACGRRHPLYNGNCRQGMF